MEFGSFGLCASYFNHVVKVEGLIFHNTIIHLQGVHAYLKGHKGGIIQAMMPLTLLKNESR